MADKQGLLEALAEAHMQPLWDRYRQLLSLEPTPSASPKRWAWQDMQPLIDRAVREVGMQDAERRVLLFCHPAFAPRSHTLPHLSSGLQILMPGEVADAHRHAAAALRFMMRGSGAVTWVDGKRCEMAEGDLVLTPAWCWHEHRNEGDEQVVWFDGLDLPLVHHLQTSFLEFGPRGSVPDQLDDTLAEAGVMPLVLSDAYRRYSPRYRYAAQAIQAALDATEAAPDGSRQLRYVNPVTGGPVMPTIDCYALRLQPRSPTRAYRSTHSAIAVVAQGAGRSTVGNETIDWEKGDVLCLPHWHWVNHCATEPGSQLFLMTDLGFLDSIGYLRTEHAE